MTILTRTEFPYMILVVYKNCGCIEAISFYIRKYSELTIPEKICPFDMVYCRGREVNVNRLNGLTEFYDTRGRVPIFC